MKKKMMTPKNNKEKPKGIYCIICLNIIVKYEMDIGDTVHLRQGYVCNVCSKEISSQMIDRV